MSIRLYNAYRLKSRVYGKLPIDEGFDIAKKYIGDNAELLRKLHYRAHDHSLKNEDQFNRKMDMNDFNPYLFRDVLNTAQYPGSPLYIKLLMSMLWDGEYHYFVFHANKPWQMDISKLISEHFGFEDYSYQNSTDPPEDVPIEEYELRRTKWKELTGDTWEFERFYKLEFMSPEHLYQHITKYHFSIYKHLAYEFDKQSERKLKLDKLV
jgi:hypothetical protein